MIGSRLRLLRALLAGGIAAAIAAIMPGPSPPTPPPGVAPAPAAWTEHFNGSANSEGNARIEGFWFSGDGLCLSPGTAGTIWYRVAAALPVPSRLHLDLWTHPAGRAPTRLQVSIDDGRTFTTIGSDLIGSPRSIAPSIVVPPGVHPMLRFDARSDSVNQELVLDRLQAVLLPEPPLARAPSRLPRALLLAGIGLLLGWWPWQPARGRTVPRPVFAAGAILLAAGAAMLWVPLRDLIAQRPEPAGSMDENFSNGVVSSALTLVGDDGLFACGDGWCLGPRGVGVLMFDLTPPPGIAAGRLTAWFHQPPRGSNTLSVSIDGGRTYRRLLHDRDVSGTGFTIPADLHRPGQPLRLRFDGINPGRDEILLLDKLVVVFTDRPVPETPEAAEVVGGLALAGFGAILAFARDRRRAAVTWAIVLVAVALRYQALLGAIDLPLDPDARTFRAHAQRMELWSPTGFYSAQFREREPGYVLATHLFFEVAGDSEFHLRLLGILLSVGVAYAGMRFAGAAVAPAAAPIAGLLLALDEPLVAESVRGLRLEFEIIAWLAFLWLVCLRRYGSTRAWLCAAGLSGAAVVLTRSSYLPAVAVLTAMSAFREPGSMSVRGGRTAAALALIVLLVLPHRVSMYRLRGDAFWDTAMYARWLANFEFTGRPGYPPRAQLMQNAYVGPRITYGHYVFALHTPGELIAGTARGTWTMIRELNLVTPREGGSRLNLRALVNGVFQAAGLIGLIAAAVSGRLRWLPVAFLLTTVPIAFLFDKGLLEARHALQALPLLLVAALRLVPRPFSQ